MCDKAEKRSNYRKIITLLERSLGNVMYTLHVMFVTFGRNVR